MTVSEKLTEILELLPDGPFRADLQMVWNQHCHGDQSDNGSETEID